MITVGKMAPNFKLEAIENKQIKEISLHNIKNKYKLLFFYPLDFTFVCPTELHAIQEKLEKFKKRNVEVIAISVDSVFSHLAWLNTPKTKAGIEGITYPLLSDIKKEVCKDYDVLKENEGIALRGVFLIDKDNIIQYAAVNNLSLGRNIDELLRLIDALQFVEKHGEVCPANWTEGKKTMKPTQEGLNEYFK